MNEGWAEGTSEDGDVGLCIARHACGPHCSCLARNAPSLSSVALPFVARRTACPAGAFVIVGTLPYGPARASGEILPVDAIPLVWLPAFRSILPFKIVHARLQGDLLISVDGVETRGRTPDQVLGTCPRGAWVATFVLLHIIL